MERIPSKIQNLRKKTVGDGDKDRKFFGKKQV